MPASALADLSEKASMLGHQMKWQTMRQPDPSDPQGRPTGKVSELALRRLREEVLDGILELIVTGTLGVGDEAKTSELWIAEQLGVSRTPVREALAILAQEGVVVRRPQVGVWVRSVSDHELAELCEDSYQLEVVALRNILRQRPVDLEVDLRHALLDLEHAAAHWRLAEPAHSQFARARDAYLRAEMDLHLLLCDRGGRDLARRSVETLGIKRRIFHVEHPIASDRVEALVRANTDLVTALLGATDIASGERALCQYYEFLAGTYEPDEPSSFLGARDQLTAVTPRWINSRLEGVENGLIQDARIENGVIQDVQYQEALGELIDLEQLDAVPADDHATRDRIRNLIAECRPSLSSVEAPAESTAPRKPQAGDRRLVRARPMLVREE